MYKDTVTLFCKYQNTWKATVLNNVDLNTDRGKIVGTYGEHCTDRAMLHIKFRPDGAKIKVGDVSWHTPEDYIGEGITFNTGDDFSFFIPDKWNGADIINDDEYTVGFFDYIASQREAYRITSVSMYSVIPHFEILGQ